MSITHNCNANNLPTEIVHAICCAGEDIRPYLFVSKELHLAVITSVQDEVFSRLHAITQVILNNLELEAADQSLKKELLAMQSKFHAVKDETTLPKISYRFCSILWDLIREAEQIDLLSYMAMERLTPRKKITFMNRLEGNLDGRTVLMIKVFSVCQDLLRQVIRIPTYKGRALGKKQLEQLEKHNDQSRSLVKRFLDYAREVKRGFGDIRTYERVGYYQFLCHCADQQVELVQDRSLRIILSTHIKNIRTSPTFYEKKS